MVLYTVAMNAPATKYSGQTPFDFVHEPEVEVATPSPRKNLRIGELLVESGIVSRKQLEEALTAQMRQGGKIANTLIGLGDRD